MKLPLFGIVVCVWIAAVVSAGTGWSFFAVLSILAVCAVGGIMEGHRMVEPLRSWLAWEKEKRDVMECQRRIDEFDEFFAGIRDSAEVWDLKTVADACEQVPSTLREWELAPPHFRGITALPVPERDGYLVGIVLEAYPTVAIADLPEHIGGIAIAYSIAVGELDTFLDVISTRNG